MRYFTAGESHGPKLTAIIEGVPAGISLLAEDINVELRRRQAGYGRGDRMKIESDFVEISSGVRHGKTLGSPITLTVENKDYLNWQPVMEVEEVDASSKQEGRLTRPRPGHADLVGGMKYDFDDLRNVLERASARETTMRVAVGAVAKRILSALDIEIGNHIVNFGGLDIELPDGLTVGQILETARKNNLSIVIDSQAGRIRKYIDQVKREGDSIGGVIEVRVENVPAGLGSYVHYDRKLDGKIAQAVIGINAIKAVEFGIGFQAAKQQGSSVMDEIIWSKEKGFARTTNSLGGFEGGMTNGEDLIIRGAMKPIPTLYKPLMSVDIESHEAYQASVERSDATALPAAGVVMENVVATVLAQEICDKFSSDTLTELEKAVADYRTRIKSY